MIIPSPCMLLIWMDWESSLLSTMEVTWIIWKSLLSVIETLTVLGKMFEELDCFLTPSMLHCCLQSDILLLWMLIYRASSCCFTILYLRMYPKALHYPCYVWNCRCSLVLEFLIWVVMCFWQRSGWSITRGFEDYVKWKQKAWHAKGCCMCERLDHFLVVFGSTESMAGVLCFPIVIYTRNSLLLCSFTCNSLDIFCSFGNVEVSSSEESQMLESIVAQFLSSLW